MHMCTHGQLCYMTYIAIKYFNSPHHTAEICKLSIRLTLVQ